MNTTDRSALDRTLRGPFRFGDPRRGLVARNAERSAPLVERVAAIVDGLLHRGLLLGRQLEEAFLARRAGRWLKV